MVNFERETFTDNFRMMSMGYLNAKFAVFMMFPIKILSTTAIFSFNGSFHTSSPPSFASLDLEKEIELPSHFILCSSHAQASFDDRAFLSVFGEDGRQWLALLTWQYPGSITLWAELDGGFYEFGEIESPKLSFWYHTCTEINSEEGFIAGSVNGVEMRRHVVKNISNTPSTLRIAMGKWTNNFYGLGDQQFYGSVANVMLFFPPQDITLLSKNICALKGDLLSWSPDKWKKSGSQWITVEEEKGENICKQSQTYRLAMPVALSIHEARDICEGKLGRGRIPQHNNAESLQNFVDWFAKTSNGACSNIWTPYSDEAKEGKFVEMGTGVEAAFLPWEKSQPNGGSGENFVTMIQKSASEVNYFDVDPTVGHTCSSCLLEKSLLLQLDGLCPGTFMGQY